jgi:hydrogenase maturation protein HypF
LINGLAAVARHTAQARGLSTVVLGGGCFFNRLLSERLARALHASGLTVLRPQALSCGDAGLALGQAWVAAHRYQAGIRPYAGEDDDDTSPFRSPTSCA